MPDSLVEVGMLKRHQARLQNVHKHIFALHQQREDIEIIVATTSKLMDEMIIDVWEEIVCSKHRLTLLAVGGYGRSELNVYSDIDLLILHKFTNNAATQLEQNGIDNFIQFLWDVGLQVGHSVRTIKECLFEAKDISVMTNMLESRLLAGDQAFYKDFDQQLRLDCVWSNAQFFDAKFNEQKERHLAYDDTTYKLEPNIKKSPGGLRDIQIISWIANKLYGQSNSSELIALGLLTEDELTLFTESRNILWRLRNALHIQAGRAEDRLLFSYQQDIAESWGFKDEPGLLAIEQLMRQYYRAAQNIRRLNGVILQLVDEKVHPNRSTKKHRLSKEFYSKNGYLSPYKTDIFVQKPVWLLRVFSVYQAHYTSIKGLSSDCARSLYQSRRLIDDDYRAKSENCQVFLALFKHESGLTHTIRLLHETGILGAFIPAFERIQGQMQHDLFHAYTVDAHTLMVIRNLRRLSLSRHAQELPNITTLMQATKNRYRLYLAALFHDIAKGRGGDHDKRGAVDAKEFCLSLGLNEADTTMVVWLVRYHLQMSKISQREDLSDPNVISKFARWVSNQENLDNLYLLTVADIRGTSTNTWTAWKGHLLSQLYNVCSSVYRAQNEGNSGYEIENIQANKKQIVDLIDSSIKSTIFDQFWEMFDEEYFLSHKSIDIAWHANAICSATALELPVVETRYLSQFDAEQYLIYTSESAALITTVTGVIDRFGQNIMQARFHVANSGFILLVFTVTNTGYTPNSDELKRHSLKMRETLLTARDYPSVVKKMLPRRLKEFSITPEIKFTNVDPEQPTSLRITALDQPGLMHIIVTVLAKCRIRLLSAHITTVGEKAKDQFMITQQNSRKALTQKQMDTLQDALLKALQ